MEFIQGQIQEINISAQQIYSLEILAMNNQEIEYLMTEEYLENPFIEFEERSYADDIDDYCENYMTYKEEDDSNREFKANITINNGLARECFDQIEFYLYDRNQVKILQWMIGLVDSDGYFRYSLKNLSELSGIKERDLIKSLKILQSFEPAGIFARNERECLKLQLKRKGFYNSTSKMLLENYLGDLREGNIYKIYKYTDLDKDEISFYIKLFRELKDKPYVSEENTDYIIPDITVVFSKGEWLVSINDNWTGDYSFNNYYISSMKKTSNKELKNYYKEKFNRAKLLFSNVEQRRTTITEVVKAIFDYQSDFFLNGGNLRPMVLEDIAEVVDLNVSTVSRAIKDKYVQYKDVYMLKDLFNQPVNKKDLSFLELSERIKMEINKENREKPLSDEDISKKLKNDGISVSRRTVAKYRSKLGFPSSRERKYLYGKS